MQGGDEQAEIVYRIDPDLSAAAFIDLLERSGLAERRPVGEPERIETMLRNADLIVTATIKNGPEAGKLVGVARSITDFVYCLYCSDLAVDRAAQGGGIGKELMRRTRAAVGPGTTCLLLSAPKAVSFYEAAGLDRHPNCFMFTQQP